MAKISTYNSSGAQTSSTDTLATSSSSSSSGSGTAATTAAKSSYEIGPMSTGQSLAKGNIGDLQIMFDTGNSAAFFYKAPAAMNFTGYTITGTIQDQSDSGAAVAIGLLLNRVSSTGGQTTLAAVDPSTVPAFNRNTGAQYTYSTPIAVNAGDLLRFRIQGPANNSLYMGIIVNFQVTQA